MKQVSTPIIIALDFPDAAQAVELASRLDPHLCRVKVGKELFTAHGPAIVEALQNKGFEVFLDLKFHDIPVTVAKACAAAASLGVWMINVHASGGLRMMEAAKEALTQADNPPLLTAVTVLTSMSQEDLSQIGIGVKPQEQVLRLARLAQQAGLDGVVCSAEEALLLRQELPPPFCLVTPGIRPQGADKGDQRRVVTPSQAVRNGVDYMVIGRPITQAQQPGQALEQIIAEIQSA